MATLSVIRRWALREHLSLREIARRTGLSRNTIKKYLRAGEAEPRYAKRVWAQERALLMPHHAGFIGGMPVASEPRQRWHAVGSAYVRRAGVLYGWSLRNLVLVVPAASFVLHPAAGPLAALLVIVVLFGFDRVQVQASSSNPPSHP